MATPNQPKSSVTVAPAPDIALQPATKVSLFGQQAQCRAGVTFTRRYRPTLA